MPNMHMFDVVSQKRCRSSKMRVSCQDALLGFSAMAWSPRDVCSLKMSRLKVRNGRSACRSPSRMDGSSRRVQFCKTLHMVQGNWITTKRGLYLRIASMTARRCSRTRRSWPKMMSYGCMALKPRGLLS